MHMDLSLGSWREIAVLTMVLYILGFVVAVVFHMRVSDVVLVEGALIIGLGGYVAMGGSEGFDRNMGTIVYPAASQKYSEEERARADEQRSKQLSKGLILMVIGAVLMVLGIVVGVSF